MYSFKKGDAVQLLFDGQKGTVVNLIDGETAYVDFAGKREIVFLAHLEKVKPEEQNVYDKKTKKAIQPVNDSQQKAKDNIIDRGIQLWMEPVFNTNENSLDYLRLYLFNDCGQALQFQYQMMLENTKYFELNKIIEHKEFLILNSFEFQNFNEKPQLQFHFKDEQGLKKTKTYIPKAKTLSKKPDMIPLLNKAAFSINLFNYWQKPKPSKNNRQGEPIRQADLDLLKAKGFEGEVLPVKQRSAVTLNAEERVIDLHIEQLVDNHRRLINIEILDIQIRHFERHIAEAIQRKETLMFIIHGVGEGVLRKEIHKRLENYPNVIEYKNEYNHRFKFGATEVRLAYDDMT